MFWRLFGCSAFAPSLRNQQSLCCCKVCLPIHHFFFIFSIFKRSNEDGDASESSISESYPSALYIRKFRNPTSPKRENAGDMSACCVLLSGSNTRHNMISITLVYLMHWYMKSQPSIKQSSSALSNIEKLYQKDVFYAQMFVLFCLYELASERYMFLFAVLGMKATLRMPKSSKECVPVSWCVLQDNYRRY